MSHIKIKPLRGVAIVILAIVMPLTFLASCMKGKNDVIEIAFDPQTSYTLKETNLKTLVSDSGVTKYKVEAATWLLFGKASEPYWYYPDGAYVEKFDSTLNVEASIKADTAYYYERKNLWEAIGNVDISNLKGERFQTSQLFWDEKKKIIYSDSFIRITKGESVNTGIGFVSNDDMSEYEIFNSTIEMPVNMRQRNTAAGDSIPQDSLYNEMAPVATPPDESDSLLRGQ